MNESSSQSRKSQLTTAYRNDPVAYAETELGVKWWAKQVEVARALISSRKVFVKAAHSVGKTHLAGGLVNWHFDCFKPSITKTTAPTRNQVVDLTWKEVRLQRRGRGMLPKAPRIEDHLASGEFDPGHFAAGYTARDADSFQGDHDQHLLIIFEEAVGIDEQFWIAAEGMLSSGAMNRWLAIMNPTDTSSTAYQQELAGGWHVITISALDHPNLAAGLRGEPKPFPKAIDVSWIEERIARWSTPLGAATNRSTDFCWPPMDFCLERGTEPQWYRPGPEFESRVLGRWPTQATGAVWSQAAWEAAINPDPQLAVESEHEPVEIGCDVARFGDDFTSIHVRRGSVSLHHESHNGWSTTQTAGRLKQLAGKYGVLSGQEPQEVLVKIDDDGVGGGVVDQSDGYNFVGLGGGRAALQQDKYPNRRSEMWFAVAERADLRRLDLSRIRQRHLNELRRQFMAPTWRLDSQGRRVVESKEQTKTRIKRSPDDADAVNLAYAPAPPGIIVSSVRHPTNSLAGLG